MKSAYDGNSNIVIITATPEELYSDIHTRNMIPDYKRREMDERAAFLAMSPEERAQAMMHGNGLLDDEARELLS